MNRTWLHKLKPGELEPSIYWAASTVTGIHTQKGRLFADDDLIRIKRLKNAGPDDFDLTFIPGGGIDIAVGSMRALVYAFCELAEQCERRHPDDIKRRFQFKTRNYKHEIRMDQVYTYTPTFWKNFCREIVKLGFNGFVLYSGYHPFEDLLDFKPFPGAAEHNASQRKLNRIALNEGLAIARQYGLRTFIQHYISHTTGEFARIDNHPFYPPGTSRVSNIDTPGTRAYQKYCYTELFRVCPDLTGLYFNFESCNNGMELVIDTALKQFNKMKTKPVAIYRLWDMNNPALVKKAVSFYKGETILAHKVMDTSDAYYWPRADSRVKEWKKILPRTEFMFLVGPCHNCGTNICGGLWNDTEFTWDLLRDVKQKGADSISFHSAPCLLTGNFPGRTNALAVANYLHLRTAADFLQGRPYNRKRLIGLYAQHFNIARPAARLVMDAVRDSSRIVLNAYQQFICNSADIGYTVPGRFSLVQEPFFFLPATYFNKQLKDNVSMTVSWLRKSRDVKVIDLDLQLIIDYADPSKPNTKDNPRIIAQRIRKAADSSRSRFEKACAMEDNETSRLHYIAGPLQINYNMGYRLYHEIMGAIALYKGYFARSRNAFLKTWEAGIAHFKAIRKYYPGDSQNEARINRMLLQNRFDMDAVLKTLATVKRHVGRTDFNYKPFRLYLQSRMHYNEIRRTVRPRRYYTKPGTFTIIRKQLQLSLEAAEQAAHLPLKPAYGRQVRRWRNLIAEEISRVKLPAVYAGRGNEQRLYYDQCFRYGMFFWDDFAAFMKPYTYEAMDDVRFSIDADRAGLVINVREIGCDTASRNTIYKAWEGAHDLSGFVRLFINPDGAGNRQICLPLLARGKGAMRMEKELVSDREILTTIPQIEKRLSINYNEHPDSWDMEVRIPWQVIGKKPRAGERWGFNIAANTAVAPLRALSWAAAYETASGHPERMGCLIFP